MSKWNPIVNCRTDPFTFKKLQDILSKAAGSGNLVDRLYIRAHGNHDTMYLRGGGHLEIGYSQYIEVKNNQIVSSESDILTGLFASGLTPSAIVVLNGCNTGSDNTSIAAKMSRLLFNRTIGGGTWYQFGFCPFATCTFVGAHTFYINGEAVYNDWYW